MVVNKSPMLADKAPANIQFPILASAKLDGVRGIVEKGVLISRSGKPLPNRQLQVYFANHPELNGLDGEVIVGDPTAKDVYRRTNSEVMSRDGNPDFTFYVFDDVTNPSWPYSRRAKMMATKWADRVQFIEQKLIANQDELTIYEEQALALGYEGLVLRAPEGHYKFGRSTAKEGLLLKLKRFADDEATVVGFEEEMENTNVATKDAFGHTERSSHKDGMVGKGRLGALVVKDVKTGVQFQIGTGFDAAERATFWQQRQKLVGKIAKYKHFTVGVKDLPRFPVFIGWRDKIDM